MSIKVKHITKAYDGQKAVDNISFSVNKGEIVGFLGPNGAGKSTVMKILTNYIKDYEGEALINDLSVSEDPLSTQRLVGYLPEQNPLYPEMFVKEFLRFNAGIYHVKPTQVEKIIKRVGLEDHAHKRIKALSKGYKQRVGLAAALLHNPDVLILDEPTTGLDPNQLFDIRALIKEEGKNKTVLFSTHIMQEVEAVCDRVIILNNGKIVADEKISYLQKDHTQIIEVEFDSAVKRQLINQIPKISEAEMVNITTWQLVFNSREDCRSLVFDFAKDQDIKILNMTKNNQDLETFFKTFTKNSD